MLLPMLAVFLIPLAQAASIGTVIMSRGDAVAIGEDGSERTLTRRSDVQLGDQLSTGDSSRLQVRMVDDALLDLRSNTEIVLEVYQDDIGEEESRVLMELVGGTLSTLTGRFGEGDEDAYQLRSANASIGIRGTGFAALYEPGSNTTFTSVNSGGVNLGSEGGNIALGTDEAFRHGEVQDSLPPRGLLTPPPQLQQALLDEQLVREEDDDEADEGTEEQDGTTEDDATTAPGPTATPDEDALAGSARLTDLEDDSLGEEDSLGEGEVETSPDVRLPLEAVNAYGQSAVFLTASSAETGVNYGTVVESDGVNYLLLYDMPMDLESEYETADFVYALTESGELTFFCPDPESSLSLFCDDSQSWFWGYWDSGAEFAGPREEDEYQEGTRLWVMDVEPDASIENFSTNLSFSTSFGTIEGSSSEGTELSGIYQMDISSAGQVTDASLSVSDDLNHDWNLTMAGDGPFIDAGTLTLDQLEGQLQDFQSGDTFDANGTVKGVFRFDGDYYFLGNFSVTAEDSDHSGVGIIIAPGSVP